MKRLNTFLLCCLMAIIYATSAWADPTLTVTGKTANGSNWDVTYKAENFTDGGYLAVLKYSGSGTPAAFAKDPWEPYGGWEMV